ncbi:DUF4424 family protein [Roseateles sp. BYS87W]|uniref:DUF4424 family protein n=1 Tax=Pelomonas baiyunensis TaxID=3299026 RepID=A0ABW7GU81_9BURK
MRRARIRHALTLAAAGLGGWIGAALTAHANDTTARVAVGGLEFTQTRSIRMESEHLVISPDRVRVDYVYRNTTDRAVRTVVAFPTPSYPDCLSESALDLNQRPVEGLHTEVNGQPVPTQRVRSVLMGTRDVTQQLRAAGLREAQIFAPAPLPFCSTRPEPEPWPAAVRKRLKAAGIVPDELRTADTYHWTQTFPPGQPVRVGHAYTPFAGGIYTFYGLDRTYAEPGSKAPPVSSHWGDHTDRACLDEGARAAIDAGVQRLLRQGAASVQMSLRDVEYILGTARNWQGPIGRFTLDVVKAQPQDIVSLCFPGRPRRVDATTLRFEHTGFTPPDRVQVNFYTLTPYDR